MKTAHLFIQRTLARIGLIAVLELSVCTFILMFFASMVLGVVEKTVHIHIQQRLKCPARTDLLAKIRIAHSNIHRRLVNFREPARTNTALFRMKPLVNLVHLAI